MSVTPPIRMRRRTLIGALGLALPWLSAAHAQDASDRDARESNHPEMAVAVAHFQAARWRELGQLVGGLPPDSACVLLNDLSDVAEVGADLSALTRVRFGHTIAGALYLNLAWRFRGTGAGDTVTGARAEGFGRNLIRSREALEHAIDRDARDGVAYTFLIRTMMGQSDVPALRSVWQDFEVIPVGRRPIRAYASMANALSRRWLGSPELMLGFARTCKDKLPPVSQALIAQTYNDFMFDVWQARDLDVAKEFAGRTDVLGEVGIADTAFHAMDAPTDTFQALYAHQEFSFFFGMLGLNDLARPHIVAMGNFVGGPWGRFDDPFEILEPYRQTLGISAT